MKSKKIFSIFLLLLSCGFVSLNLYGYSKKPVTDDPEAARSTLILKKYMSDFGTLVAGMEIMKYKDQKPDWEAIDITIQEMNRTLEAMKQADQAGNYREFTDILEKNLAEVKSYGKKRDKKVFDAFDKVTDACFKCHAAHRPSDFLVPKEKEPRISGEKSSRLFQGSAPRS
jgi:hypothetical protein